MKLYHVEVNREFLEDSFSFHLACEEKPTEEQLVEHIRKEHFVDTLKEECEISLSPVKFETFEGIIFDPIKQYKYYRIPNSPVKKVEAILLDGTRTVLEEVEPESMEDMV